MKHVLIASLLVAFLTACSSVKLDPAPVDDKSGTLVGKGVGPGGAASLAAGANAGGATGAGVGSVGAPGSGAGAGASGTNTGGAGGPGGAGLPDDRTKSAVTQAQVDTPKKPSVPDLQSSAKVVYFDYDSSEIKPEFQVVLQAHARMLRADKALRVALEGHTDARGGREYNLALGQKRAESVRSAMSLLGVPDSQVEAVSFGMEKPAAQGSDEASFAKNRRVEINYR